ncbi:MAG: hypothetical protein FWH35_04275 [Treponema sp.]|nr:hypothetical protein [Treponema sp.]
MEANFSCIICIADINITEALDQCLFDLALPEVFIQRAKQISLAAKHRFLSLRKGVKLEESRALIYRLYVPSEFQQGVMRRITEVTDLGMGGRGCIFSQQVDLYRGTPYSFDLEKLERLCGKGEKHPAQKHTLISCTIPRGGGDSLAEAILELGACVPIVFFGDGVGLRDKLGLLRITIPVEKEIIWFIVPNNDADLIEKTLIPRARIDVPGQGFLYKFNVFAPVVNLRVRQGKRTHAATMEQVIAALDEVRGGSDWRRMGTKKLKVSGMDGKSSSARGLFFIGEEEDVEIFRKTAMHNGANGATLNTLEMRSYSGFDHGQEMESHFRMLCDIITTPAIEEKVYEELKNSGFFDIGKSSVLKAYNIGMPVKKSNKPPRKNN